MQRAIRGNIVGRKTALAAAVGFGIICAADPVNLMAYGTEDHPAVERLPFNPALGYFLRGDSNGDWGVDLSDAIFTMQYLFLSGQAPVCLASADANDDESVNITDVITTLGMLFGSSFASGSYGLPGPWPIPGYDSTPGLPCELSTS